MIDLRSDTVTIPDDAMRQAMAEAPVGDDVYGEDPTVNRLEARTSEVLGTEDALFCPSGTMANQVAIDVWTTPGEELVLEAHSHIYSYELGGAARLAGLQTRPIDASPRGAIDPDVLADTLREEALHVAGTGLVALENTHNSHGGRTLSVETLADAAAVAHDRGIPVHLDGARLWNAAVATDTDIADFVDVVDSVMVSLSKGLGAPVGSMLAGPSEFIEAARRSRKAFGGGMRQAGILAAAGLEGLSRRGELERDHELATRLAAGIADVPDIEVIEPESNIVLIELADTTAGTWLDACNQAGVAGTDIGEHAARFVTHRDVDEGDIEAAIEAIHEAHA